jgi:hypothetical protein
MSEERGQAQTTDPGGGDDLRGDDGDVELAEIPTSNPVPDEHAIGRGDEAVDEEDPDVNQGDGLQEDHGTTVQEDDVQDGQVPPPQPANNSDGDGRQEDTAVGQSRSNVSIPIIFIAVIAMAAAIIALSVVIVFDDGAEPDPTSVPITPPDVLDTGSSSTSPSSPPTASTVEEEGPPDDDFIQGDSLAKMPQGIVEFFKDVVFLPPGSDGLRPLALLGWHMEWQT